SELSRQIVRALAAADGGEVWALAGGPAADGAAAFWTAAGSRARFVSRAVLRAMTTLDGWTVVITHVHLAPLARPLAARGARVVIVLVGVESWRPRRARERRALERADRVIAISAHTARRFREANPGVRLSSDIDVCLLGAGPAPTASPSLVDGGFALIVGRMWAEERYKGHDRLIEIWPDVRARVPGARLVVVGEGDDRSRLEARAAEAGVAGAITFVGRVDDAELAGLYRACAFFVMPSPNEGFGLAFVEAMRAGKPCIAVHGSADEIIRDGIDGFVLEPDAALLRDAVVRLFSNDDERARMGAAARARAEDMFTEQRFADRLRAAVSPDRPVPAGLAS
ncbi:MAG: glycosyltransferase family 4 protein, partial [Vicinamibacterales bacterium]